MVKRDYQRQRLYDWENSQWWYQVHHREATHHLTIEQMEVLARHLTGQRIRVLPGKRRVQAAGCPYRKAIWMPRWARTRVIFAHELAHTQCYDMHGPQFVARYLLLLHRMIEINPIVNRMSAIDSGLDVDHIQEGEDGSFNLWSDQIKAVAKRG